MDDDWQPSLSPGNTCPEAGHSAVRGKDWRLPCRTNSIRQSTEADWIIKCYIRTSPSVCTSMLQWMNVLAIDINISAFTRRHSGLLCLFISLQQIIVWLRDGARMSFLPHELLRAYRGIAVVCLSRTRLGLWPPQYLSLVRLVCTSGRVLIVQKRRNPHSHFFYILQWVFRKRVVWKDCKPMSLLFFGVRQLTSPTSSSYSSISVSELFSIPIPVCIAIVGNYMKLQDLKMTDLGISKLTWSWMWTSTR